MVDVNGEYVCLEEVVCDFVGVGIGEYVFVVCGNVVRSVFVELNSVIDLVIIVIVDSFDK